MAVALKKGKKHRKSKERQESPLLTHRQESKASPLVSQRIAIAASVTTKLDSNEAHELSKDIKVDLPSLRSKQADWAVRGRLQRSCSVDDLNPLGDDKETKPKSENISVPRRFSTEASFNIGKGALEKHTGHPNSALQCGSCM